MTGPTDAQASAGSWDRTAGAVRLKLSDRSTLVMSGSVLDMDPGALLMPHIRDLHDQIVREGIRTFVIDVRTLTFVNSSGIRVFIDWLGLIQRSKSAYTLRVVMDPAITWQRLTFGALESVARGVVVLDKRTKES